MLSHTLYMQAALDSYFRKKLHSALQDSLTLPASTGDIRHVFAIVQLRVELFRALKRGPGMPPRASQKKTKRKAVDSDGQANSAKKSRAGAQASAVLQEPILADKPSARRSGRPGAGKGGRAEQLEKIGALLDAPARTTQPKGSTSLDLDVPTNPLAPEPSRKGRGSRSKASLFLLILDGNVEYRQKPPPPYTVSETVVDPTTSKTGRKKATSKVTKNALTPTTDADASNTQPTFSHRQPGGRFGFAQSIVPPGTEPDLQALNNPFVAAAREKRALSVSLDPNRRLLPTDTSRNNDLAQPAPSKSRSSMQPNTTFHKNLDPALLSVGDVHLGAGYTGSESSEASTDDNDDDGGHADDDEEEDEEEEEEGDVEGQEVRWGAAHGCLTAHPGFSKEVEPSQPRVTTALPTDFEFQHSRDEDDNMADKNLAAGTSSDDDNIPDDVLQLHHKRNGHPRLPDPAVLDLLHQAETKPPDSKPSDTNIKARKVSANITGEGPKATQLGWYGPRWKRFLEETKGECRVQHAIENLFPTFIDGLSGTIPEILTASLVQWLESGQQVEGNIWPDYKPEMAKLLFEDLSTWRSDLKKITISITPSMYDLVPPSHVPPQERAMWVEEHAAKLLELSFFLRNAVISFFYTGSYRIARRRPEVFREQLPLECLYCVKNGNGKLYPKFSAKEYKSIYIKMVGLLNDIIRDPYHGPKLVEQLRSAQSFKVDGNNISKHHHLQVLLD
ncbi:uncharacterized protein F5891DRAFT_1194100 [Suillus fuscotomentosus]|uniref:DUF6532 domain-containing protein n=1 Tax=Suillus fuscotomentosus TaxID=1912939 RepID=A0AAD4DZN6_9AGAM|nr:uncharacterized protein F5891DRAFT_1194100 [Suillus fuscotomentosus]KAG1895578.1 hypothetical protein F5891DRAFT_1194100 [Suillus fuscotomentosus]